MHEKDITVAFSETSVETLADFIQLSNYQNLEISCQVLTITHLYGFLRLTSIVNVMMWSKCDVSNIKFSLYGMEMYTASVSASHIANTLILTPQQLQL